MYCLNVCYTQSRLKGETDFDEFGTQIDLVTWTEL